MKKLMGVMISFFVGVSSAQGEEVKNFKVLDQCESPNSCQCVGTNPNCPNGQCAPNSAACAAPPLSCSNTCGSNISPQNESTIYQIPAGLVVYLACASGNKPTTVSGSPQGSNWLSCNTTASYPPSPIQATLSPPSQGDTYVMNTMIFSCPEGESLKPFAGVWMCSLGAGDIPEKEDSPRIKNP